MPQTLDFGGAERDRTADLLVANEALSQLSYSPPPNPHRTLLTHAQRSRNNISECTSNHPPDSTKPGDRRQGALKLPLLHFEFANLAGRRFRSQDVKRTTIKSVQLI